MMRISVFEWPEDMEPNERSGIADVEGIAREAVRNVPTGPRGPALAYDALEDALIRSTSAPAITRLLRIVTDHEPLGAIRVRFTWHRWERERRENAARVRSWNEREDAARRRRVIAQLEANDLNRAPTAPRPHLTTPIREIARSAMTPAQWGSARDGRGVCGICEAGPSTWCDTVAHERRRGTTTVVANATIRAGAMVTVSDGEIREARENPLNLNAARMLEEAERLEAMGLTPRDLVTMPREELERAAAPLSSLSAEGRETYDRLLAQYAAPMPGTSSSYGLASGRALDAEERRSSEDREYRREVLGEWADPALRPRMSDVIAELLSQSGPTRTGAEVRAGWIAFDTPTGVISVKGDDERGLADRLAANRGRRAWYVAAPAPVGLAPMSIRPDDDPGLPGYYIRRAAATRQDRGAELLIAGLRAALYAWVLSRFWTERLLEVLRVVLRAWSASPALLELDIDHAPFGVDVSPPADDAAARYALLEVDTPPTIHNRR